MVFKHQFHFELLLEQREVVRIAAPDGLSQKQNEREEVAITVFFTV